MHKINSKIKIDQNDVNLLINKTDGYCFYRVISQFYNQDEIYHICYRKELMVHINKKNDNDKIAYPYIFKKESLMLEYDEYFNEIKLAGTFAGEYEIINTSQILNCNLVIYRNPNFNHNLKLYKFEYETIIAENYIINPFKPIILIVWVNNNHYTLIIPKTENIKK